VDKTFHSKNSHNSSQRQNLQKIILQNRINQHFNRYKDKRDTKKSVKIAATKDLTTKTKVFKKSLIIQTINVRTSHIRIINRDHLMVQEENLMKESKASKRKMIGTRIRIISQPTKSRPIFKMMKILR
jgi:hypothetical protein